MSGQIFRHPHRVTYAECTLGNHVYYSRYLDMLEAARGEFFRHLGQPLLRWQEREVIFPVVECRVRYRGAARYDDTVQIEVWVETMEKVRLGLGYRVVNEAGLIFIEATTVHACATPHDKLQRLPEELSRALAPFLPSAQDRGA